MVVQWEAAVAAVATRDNRAPAVYALRVNETLSAALLAFVGYTFLNLGQAGQKIGLAMKSDRPAPGWTLWVFATLATSVSFWFVFAAISIGTVSLAGAMSGTGLASLAIFSRIVMNERLGIGKTIALAGVIAGAALVAWFAEPGGTDANLAILYGFLGVGAIAYSIGAVLAHGGSLAGVMLGGLSGFLGAYSQLFQRLGGADLPWSDGPIAVIASMITDPVTAIWIGLSIASMIVIQFSYRHGQATQIIPVFTANLIVVPVVGGVLVFAERLSPVQWVGVAAVLAGSVVLGRRRAEALEPSRATR